MLVEVKNPNCIPGTNQPEMVPAGFVVCSGEKTPEKLHLTNHMVCDWQVRFKKLRFKNGDCPFYQPVAQNMLIRAFLALCVGITIGNGQMVILRILLGLYMV